MPNFENKIVEVCSECCTASCCYGEFMCFESRNANIYKTTVAELRIKDLEHEDNWNDEKMEAIYGDAAPFGYKAE